MLINATTRQSLAYVRDVVSGYEKTEVSQEISPSEDMLHDWDKNMIHYYRAGGDALEIILGAMCLTETTSIKTILDLPCGFGRVARHLRAAFPQAELHCCELYQDRVDFCAKAFNATGVKSKEDFDKIEFSTTFDLIWSGSLMTHLPEKLFKKCLALFSRSLSPNGIAVITTQGRHAPYIQKNLWKLMPDDQFPLAEEDYNRTGFGYVDYNAKDRFFEQDAYGISLSSPSYVMRCLEEDKSIRIQGLMERRWDNCQDVVIFKKTPVHAER